MSKMTEYIGNHDLVLFSIYYNYYNYHNYNNYYKIKYGNW